MVSNLQGMGPMRPPMGQMQAPKALSDEQQAKVKEILSNFDPENLTTTNAKSIFSSLEQAGIRGGGGLRDTIQSLGFDAEQVWSLAHDGQKGPPPPPPPPPSGQGSGTKINASSLQALQTILSQFDLGNLSGEDQTSLISQLNQSGLLQKGSTIDLGV